MNGALGALRRVLAGSPRRIFLTSFTVFFALSTAFAVGSPIGSAPDDQVQMVKAAATARLEINGTRGYVQEMMAQGESKQPVRYYNVPNSYGTMTACYATQPNVSAACSPPIRGGARLDSELTTAGQYNPIYYFAVGWPSLIFTGQGGMYLMRVMSGLLCALLLAGAVVTAAQWRRGGLAVLGVLTAATPMVLFLNGMVNPNGVEASSAVLAWTVALSITLDPRRDLLKRRLVWLAVALAVLANARPLGTEWVAGVVVVALLVQQRGVLPELLRSRAAWVATALTAAALLFGAGWSMTHGDDAVVPYVPQDAFAPAAHATLDLTNWYIQGMIGYFGWLDTPSPQVTYTIWLGVIVLMIVLVWAVSKLRESLMVLAMVLGVVLIPVLAQGVEAKHIGQIWQGRYLLAFAVGLPIMCGMLLAKNGGGIPAAIQKRLTTIAGVLLAFASFAAFFRCARRYGQGMGKSLIPIHMHWQPPGTWLLWLPVYALALVALVLLTFALGGERELDGAVPAQPSAPAEELGEATAKPGGQSPQTAGADPFESARNDADRGDSDRSDSDEPDSVKLSG